MEGKMEKIGGAITLTTAASLILILSAFWMFKLIVRKEKEHYFRGFLIFVLALTALLYIQREETKKLSLLDVKETLFPQKIPQVIYRVESGKEGDIRYTRYFFDDPKPRLSLTMDKKGRYFHITNVSQVNRILKELDLPEVEEGAPELASLTGSKFDINQYVWKDYPPGILTLERTLCRNQDTVETFHCLELITIRRRY